MNKPTFFIAVLILASASFFTCNAQLDGDYAPDLTVLEIPVFDGVPLAGDVSAVSFDLTMVQSLTSSKLTGTGTVSATAFDVYQDEGLVVDFDGDMNFSASAMKTGSLVRLTGAKATLSGVTGTGLLYDPDTDTTLDVTLTSVTGAFLFKSLHVDLDAATIGGGTDKIAAGALKITGYENDDTTARGTVVAKYGAEDFPELDFPAENIITPDISFTLNTSSKGVVTGDAVGTFGDYDDVPFGVKGRLNSKTGVTTISLKGQASNKSITATLSLDENGDLIDNKNSLNVLGYKLKF
ncbi:MAG: hypothetical protein EBS53_03190 [Bacteroidetes bacterium]|nr:hypothetical protein [Bacteroidota bacterium]